MPRPSKSTLIKPRSAQSSLSHSITTRPGMVAGSSGTIAVELALADHHASGMLAQMPRQILRGHVQLEKFADSRIGEIEAGLLKLAFGRVVRIAPAPAGYQ